MTDVQIEVGDLLANVEERTISGLLVPYGEVGNTNLGKFEIPKGTVSLPLDASIVGLNIDHARENPIGRTATLTDTEQGVTATFSVARTPEGDAALADAASPTGTRKKLSVEMTGIVLRAGKLVAGRIFGAALVAQGAFPSASLLAADVGTVPTDTTPPADTTPAQPVVDKTVEEFTDEHGVKHSRTTTTTTKVDGDKTTITQVVVITEPANPDTTPKEPNVGNATVPNTLTATAPAEKSPRTSLTEMSIALAQYFSTGSRDGLDLLAEKFEDGADLFAALSDVKLTSAGSVGVNIMQPQWLGELWDGKAFERRIIPLLNSRPLTSFNISGFRWGVKPAMAAWGGDKAAITSNAPTTVPFSESATRWAGAHDIAREFRDFSVPGFWEAYFKAMTESYSKITDDYALAELVAGATAVVAGAVPAGANAAMVSIVDGALAVLDEGLPSYALVAKDLYRSILLQKDIDRLAYLNTALGLEDGTLASFRVVPTAGLAAGRALVGVKGAATSMELPGVPIRTESLDMIKGGIDEALFGYSAITIDNPLALALVTPAP